jgi:hypothetical protein
MSVEYVNALIQIPIKVSQDETFEVMSDYMKIEIENCIELPEKRDISSRQLSLYEQIQSALKNKRLEKEKVILPAEKPPKRRPQNITFKRYSNKRRAASRNTAKYYDDDEDDDTTQSESDSDLDEDDSSNLDNAEDKRSNPLNVEDKDADLSQLQEVEELEPEYDESYLSLKEGEYLE